MENINIGLGMPYKNDIDMLTRNLPKIPDGFFFKTIFIDTGSTDGSTELIQKRFPTAIIIKDQLPYIDFAHWRDNIMNRAEQEGCDWVFMLDSDEALFESDYELAKQYMLSGVATLYRLSRIDFVKDKEHPNQDYIGYKDYPDWQARLLKCGAGYKYAPRIHAQPCLDGETIQGVFIPHVTIYHYGWTRSAEYKTLHYYNADRSKEGLPMVSELPPDVPLIEHANLIPFYGKQP